MKLFVWVGHPRENSFCHALADAYAESAAANGADIRRMNLHDMDLDPDLTFGYEKRKTLEPCLEDWRENILWADHLLWVYPQWWGGMPAKMKGVLDRAFLPGFAMSYHENDPWWDKLLTGRTADILITADSPDFYDRSAYGAPAQHQVRNLVLKFSGIKPLKIKQMGTVKTAKPEKLKRWLNEAGKLGARL